MEASSKRVCGSMDSRATMRSGSQQKAHTSMTHMSTCWQRLAWRRARNAADERPTTAGEGGRRLSMRLDSPPVTSTPSIAASSAGAEPLPLIQYCFRTYGGAGLLHSTRLTALYTPNDPPAVF